MARSISEENPHNPAPQAALARMLVHQPEAMCALKMLEAALAGSSTLPNWLKELVLARVAALNGCQPCIRLHLGRASRNGLTPDLAAAITGDAPATTAELRAALALAEALTTMEAAALPDAVAEARMHYSAEQVNELFLLAATANMVNRLMAVAGL